MEQSDIIFFQEKTELFTNHIYRLDNKRWEEATTNNDGWHIIFEVILHYATTEYIKVHKIHVIGRYKGKTW